MHVEVLAAEPSAWDRRRSDMAMRIELCALQLCVKQGIDETTVEDIAQAAGISRRTFYRYFGAIDDILIAMPKRSLARISMSVAERPASEGIREAFVNASHSHPPSDAEREILALAGRLAELYPVPWFRAMGLVQSRTMEVYERAVTERLALTGQDTRFAPMVAAVLLAVIHYMAQFNFKDGKFSPSAVPLDEALSALAHIIK